MLFTLGVLTICPFVSSFIPSMLSQQTTFIGRASNWERALQPPSILLETERVLAIDKPHRVPHHSDAESGEKGVLSLLRQCQKDGLIGYEGRLYGVHRLDRVTSGILLLAKDHEMASTLTEKFRHGGIVKYYCGISAKKPRKKQGWVKGDMVRGRRKSWYLTRDSHETSHNYAMTRFFTASLSGLKDHIVVEHADPRTLVLFRPYTGKTHQLRVAAKSVGLPLLGDPIYRDGTERGSSRSLRTFLHATAIHVPDLLGAPLTVWSPPPFHFLWNDTAAPLLDDAIFKTFEKHCDCDEVRRIILS
mmetsp:Transcript_15934/g.26985  ORF Transcript_15934/g.26985 Transcript_15934/m.26985 type:complete len:303 (-) Transcript_15934:263-1171(-)